MIEDLKQKAVLSMYDKIGEIVITNQQDLPGLVKMNRLDSKFGNIQTDFKSILLYIKEADLALIGDIVTVRNVDYEVVKSKAKSEYNGFARIELQEPSGSTATGPWK